MSKEKVLEFKTINDVLKENAVLKREKRDLNGIIENEITELKIKSEKDKSDFRMMLQENKSELRMIIEKDKLELKSLIDQNSKALKTRPKISLGHCITSHSQDNWVTGMRYNAPSGYVITGLYTTSRQNREGRIKMLQFKLCKIIS